jgi:ribosomal-protein-alanine N-acetyltransferase
MKRFEIAAFPTLTTDRLILREVVAEDANGLLVFRGDPEAQKYNLVPMKDTLEAVALVRTMQAWYASGYAIQWGITLRDEHQVLGLCGLHDWNRKHHRASIGYDLARSHWGQGIATEAMRAVLRYGFEQWNLNRIEAITIVDNARSIRLLERLGFQLEGIRREHSLEKDGLFHGSAVYGLLRSEYTADATASADGQG